MNKRIAFYLNELDGCGYYRTLIPYNFLKQYYQNISLIRKLPTVDALGHSTELNNHDVFIFQRLMLPHFHQLIFPYLKSQRKKIIIDMDDLLWDIPEYNDARYFWNSQALDNLTKNLEMADIVSCSTFPLAAYISQHINPNVVIIPNHIDKHFHYRKIENDKIRIGWCGSPSHFGDFTSTLVEHISTLVEKGKIEFFIFGDMPPQFENIAHHVGWCPVERYYDTLNSLNLDLGLIVCKDNDFNNCKSPIKFFEYSICSIPTIADKVIPYVQSIIPNETGLIVEKESDWKTHINYLIKNKEERHRISKNAYDIVNTNHLTRANTYMKYWTNFLL